MNWLLKIIRRNKIKALVNKKTGNLKVENAQSYDIGKIISLLGGKSKIQSINATISTLSIEVEDQNSVDISGLKRLLKCPIMVTPKNLKLVVGPAAKSIKEQILNNKKTGN